MFQIRRNRWPIPGGPLSWVARKGASAHTTLAERLQCFSVFAVTDMRAMFGRDAVRAALDDAMLLDLAAGSLSPGSAGVGLVRPLSSEEEIPLFRKQRHALCPESVRLS
jgi:hypothetical protein